MTYQTTAGTCAAADDATATFVTGQAQKLRLVDSAGWELAATILLPAEAVADPSTKRPGVVFANGAQAAMQTDPQILSRFEPFELPRWQDDESLAKFLRAFERLLPLREA